MNDLKHQFLAYCTDYSSSKPRLVPLNQRTVGRYLRGLNLAEKLIGHTLDRVSEDDQYRFLEKIVTYKQGTRRVTMQIFQRFIHWGRKQGYFTCENLLISKYNAIIGERQPTTYKSISPHKIRKFFSRLTDPKLRLMLGVIYFGGVTTAELPYLMSNNITYRGFFIQRGVTGNMDFIALPTKLSRELNEYALDHVGPVFELRDDIAARMYINKLFKQAQIDTNMLHGTTIRDVRTSGIREFFNRCNDLEMTKRFAGVHNGKHGWLDSLLDISNKDMMKINQARRFYGNSEEDGPSVRE